MEAQLSIIHVVSLPGMKFKFKIPDSDVLMVDSKPFVRIAAYNPGLSQLICEDNPDAPPMHKKHGLTGYYTGIDKLLQLRNEAQAQDLVPKGGSTLFSGVGASHCHNPPPKRKTRQTRMQLASKRANKEVLQVTLEHNGACKEIDVLRPVHPMDGLYVLYDTYTMTEVVNFIRTFGFHRKEPRLQHQGAPGIQAIKDKGYLVVMKGETGIKKRKVAKTYDEAVGLLSNGMCDEANGDGDHSDDIGASGGEGHAGVNQPSMVDDEHKSDVNQET